MSPYFLLLPILLPILSGVLLLVLPDPGDRGRNRITQICAWADSLLVFLLLAFGSRESAPVYSFIRGFVIAFRLDGPAALFAGMLALMWPMALLYAYEYMENAPRRESFFAFYLMTYGVALGLAFSANLVTIYVFFEMLTLVTIPLVSHPQDREGFYAGRIYTVYCIMGASMAFIAVVMGTLDGSGDFLYGGNLAGLFDARLMRVVFLFGFFGFGTKAAVFPLFRWLLKASVAPTPVTALLHAVAVVNAGMFAVTRLAWYAYGPALLSGSAVQGVCVLTAAFSMVFAAGMALRQRHIKRRLAYSTMSNLSYMLFGVMLLTPAGLMGGLAHMLLHGIIKMSLFLCAGAFMHKTGKAYLYELDGAGRAMPFTFTAYTLGALSLTGVPMFCGFVSKWLLLRAGIDAGTPPALAGVAALIVSAFLCAIYTLTVSVRAFFPVSNPPRETVTAEEADWRMLLPIGLFTALNLALGISSGPLLALLRQIARA